MAPNAVHFQDSGLAAHSSAATPTANVRLPICNSATSTRLGCADTKTIPDLADPAFGAGDGARSAANPVGGRP